VHESRDDEARYSPSGCPDVSRPVSMPHDELTQPAAPSPGAGQVHDECLTDSNATLDGAVSRVVFAPDPPSASCPAERDGFGGQSAGTRQRAKGEAAAAAPCSAPECGEPAADRVPVDLVPWEARGMQRPQWSHTDRSALCPVPGPCGGYQLAEPTAAKLADPDTARLDPPLSMRCRWPFHGGAREIEAG
jgi:hypothetical protein